MDPIRIDIFVNLLDWNLCGKSGEAKIMMSETNRRKYVFVAVVSAIGGGLIVAIMTEAIPKMITRMMGEMISNMKENGCNPTEI